MSNGRSARVLAFANPFAADGHDVEVLIDWSAPYWTPPDWIDLEVTDPLAYDLYVFDSPTPPRVSDEIFDNPGSSGGFLCSASSVKFLRENDGEVARRYARELLEAVEGRTGRGLKFIESAGDDGFASFLSASKPIPTLWEAPHFHFVFHPSGNEVGVRIRCRDEDDTEVFTHKVHQALVGQAHQLLVWRKKVDDATNSPEGTRKLTAREPALVDSVRRLCRDEPTIAHLLLTTHHLRFAADCLTQLILPPNHRRWLLARPKRSGRPLPLSEFRPIATRLGQCSVASKSRPITILSSDGSITGPLCGYMAADVSLRQVKAEKPIGSHHGGGIRFESIRALRTQLAADQSLEAALDVDALQSAAVQFWHNQSAHDRRSLMAAAEVPEDQQLAHFIAERTEAVQSMRANRPPYDAIAVRWELPTLLREDPANPIHTGFKGYRIDVRTRRRLGVFPHVVTSPWASLSLVERVVVRPGGPRALDCNDRADLVPREGHMDIPFQRDPSAPEDAAAPMVVPTDFAFLAGSSLVVPECLDQLGAIAHGSPSDLSLEELSARGVQDLRYLDEVGVRVRKVGLTGLGPPPDYDSGLPAKWLEFRRTLPMARPEVRFAFDEHEFQRIDCEVDKSAAGTALLDGTYRLHRAGGRWGAITVKARPPLCHWRVAMHVLGTDGGQSLAFEEACLAFARRAIEARQAGLADSPHVAFLEAADPHVDDVRLRSLVWYPFSDDVETNTAMERREDRYVPSGVAAGRAFRNNGRGFYDTVVQAEEWIAADSFPLEFMVQIAEGGLDSAPRAPSNISYPILYRGFANRIEATGEWTSAGNKARTIPAHLEDREPWSARLVVVDPKRKMAIGGRPKNNSPSPSRRYAGLRFHERWLTTPPSGNSSSTALASEPARGALIDWRRHFFDTAPDNCRGSYEEFVGMILGADVLSPAEEADRRLIVRVRALDDSDAFVAPAITLPKPVTITQTSSVPPFMECEIGKYAKPGTTDDRSLPFVDQDIAWIVRLDWCVSVHPSSIVERPRDLAAIKEFRLYRREKGTKPECEKPLATIRRPPEDVFRPRPSGSTQHLDEVQWVWIDAVTDRDKHVYEYEVVAVPEYPEAFTEQTWIKHEVVIPACKIAPRPERMVPVPLRPLPDAPSASRIGLHFPGGIRGTRIAYGLRDIDPDKLLVHKPNPGTENLAGLKDLESCAEAFVLDAMDPVVITELPAKPSIDRPCNDPAKPSYRWSPDRHCNDPLPMEWAGELRSEASTQREGDCGENPKRLPVFDCDVARVVANEGPLRQNAFFRLFVASYNAAALPAVQHTAASDLLETEWLQAYPAPLRVTVNQDVFKLGGVVEYGGGDLLRYRFHVFVADPLKDETPAFHLATYYRQVPDLVFADIEASFATAMTKFMSGAPARVRVFVGGEEGILAPTYRPPKYGAVEVQEGMEQIYGVLRGAIQTAAVVAVFRNGKWGLE